MLDIENILDYLGKEEGLVVHRNKYETDITSPYGIYASVHSSAPIFVYIKSVGLALGLPKTTKMWSRKQRENFNLEVDKSPRAKTELRNLAKEFYIEYYSKIFLELFPKESQLAMISSYTTSERGAKLATQRAINDMILSKHLNLNPLVEDGDFGSKTNRALKALNNLREEEGEWVGQAFEWNLIRHMGIYYADLIIRNPEKYKINYNGWKARMQRLAQSK